MMEISGRLESRVRCNIMEGREKRMKCQEKQNAAAVKRKRRRLFVWLSCAAGLLSLLVLVNFIPAWQLKTAGMHRLTGRYVNVYYEKEELAARDVFLLAEQQAEYLSEKLSITQKQKINIYIYDHQSTMQTKKYGFIAPLLSLDWYIGDNIGTDVILTSPANPGKAHDYEEVKEAVLHEMVHAYVSLLNPDIRLWLTEGMALYLSNGEKLSGNTLLYMEIPAFSDTKTSNPLKFERIGGYTYANTYIEYLSFAYGWEAVLGLIRTEDFESVFGKTERDIYEEWTAYLERLKD